MLLLWEIGVRRGEQLAGCQSASLLGRRQSEKSVDAVHAQWRQRARQCRVLQDVQLCWKKMMTMLLILLFLLHAGGYVGDGESGE